MDYVQLFEPSFEISLYEVLIKTLDNEIKKNCTKLQSTYTFAYLLFQELESTRIWKDKFIGKHFFFLMIYTLGKSHACIESFCRKAKRFV